MCIYCHKQSYEFVFPSCYILGKGEQYIARPKQQNCFLNVWSWVSLTYTLLPDAVSRQCSGTLLPLGCMSRFWHHCSRFLPPSFCSSCHCPTGNYFCCYHRVLLLWEKVTGFPCTLLLHLSQLFSYYWQAKWAYEVVSDLFLSHLCCVPLQDVFHVLGRRSVSGVECGPLSCCCMLHWCTPVSLSSTALQYRLQREGNQHLLVSHSQYLFHN